MRRTPIKRHFRIVCVALGVSSWLLCTNLYADSSAAAHYKQGLAAKQAGDATQAIDAFNKAIEADETYAAAHFSVGLLYRDQKDYGRALVHLERARQLQPKSAKVYYSLALAQYYAGDRGKAIATLKQGVALDPTDAQMQGQLGVLLLRTDPRAAARYLEAAVKLAPDEVSHLHQLGIAYRRASAKEEGPARKKLLKQAEAKLTAAHQQKASPEINFDLAVVYRQQGQFEKAARHYRAAIDLNDSFAAAWWDLGHVLMELGKNDQAVAAFKKYQRLNSGTARAVSAQKRIDELSGPPK